MTTPRTDNKVLKTFRLHPDCIRIMRAVKEEIDMDMVAFVEYLIEHHWQDAVLSWKNRQEEKEKGMATIQSRIHALVQSGIKKPKTT